MTSGKRYTNFMQPRKKIHFSYVDGEVKSNGYELPEIMKRPLYKDKKNGTIEGRQSGVRSGLVVIENGDGKEVYKLKGCMPSRDGKSVYGESYGGQTISRAEYEAENINDVKEAFSKLGLQYPMMPVGFYIYRDFEFKEEPCASGIYRILGDRRLDEILAYVESYLVSPFLIPISKDEKIRDVIERFGTIVGRAVRTFHNAHYTWDWYSTGEWNKIRSNAHDGNVVIFNKNGKEPEMCAAPIDMDNMLQFRRGEGGIMKSIQRYELSTLINHIANPKISGGNERRYYLRHPFEIRKKNVMKRLEELVGEDHVLQRRFVTMVEYLKKVGYDIGLRKIFIKGLKKGYNNPDIDVKLTMGELYEVRWISKTFAESRYPELFVNNLKKVEKLIC
jgi:hypothetical protein